MPEILTVEKLKAMKPGEIFQKGTTTDNSIGINIWGTGTPIKWVAVRGSGHHDWCVYLRGDWNKHINSSDDSIKRVGDKCPKSQVHNIMNMDTEAFSLYRE